MVSNVLELFFNPRDPKAVLAEFEFVVFMFTASKSYSIRCISLGLKITPEKERRERSEKIGKTVLE